MLGACSACFGSNPSSETNAASKDTENTKTLSKNWVFVAEQDLEKRQTAIQTKVPDLPVLNLTGF